MSSNQSVPNLQKMVAMGSAVVGGIALVTKLGIDEFQHRNMKAKTDPSNAYSSIRILPDLVRFQGYIRIHRHKGKIVEPVPRAIEIIEAEEEKKNDTEVDKNDETEVSNNENVEGNDVDDTRMNDKDDDSDHIVNDNHDNNDNNNHNKNNSKVEIKWIDPASIEAEEEEEPKKSGWFSSLSNFASSAKKSLTKLQTMIEQPAIEFVSDFPFILKDSAIHKTDLEQYIMHENRFLDLFEPIQFMKSADQKNPQKTNNSKEPPLSEKWEFCFVKIHHETLYIRYAKKWITLPLNQINISPLTLNNNDCTAFIVDYTKYFTISENGGYVLLCQHLDDPTLMMDKREMEAAPIDIPVEHSSCPWPFVQTYLIGYHNTNYVSLRKEQVLKAIVERVSIAMKDVGFDNHRCYDHSIQFRKCIDTIISKMDGADKALEFKRAQSKKNNDKEEKDDNPYYEYGANNNKNDKDEDNDIPMSSKQEAEGEPEPMVENVEEKGKQSEESKDKIMQEKQKEVEEEKKEEMKEEFLPYLNLLNDAYHGLNVGELSETDWKLTAEASWLSNYVYDIHIPQREQRMKRRDSWTSFKSYISFASNTNLDTVNEQTSNMDVDDKNDNNDNQNDNQLENENHNHNNNQNYIDDMMDDGLYKYCGPPHLSKNPLWRKHNRKHCENLAKCGFQLLDYAITQPGQSVQWMITRSYDNPNTIFLTFKGTSNPLDAMVNIGLHPLELPHFQCSVYSGMYAALQQSLPFICKKLNVYRGDEYYQNNSCPPVNDNDDDGDNDSDDYDGGNNNKNITKIHKLVINGHSLGGGYGQLFLAHLLSVPEFEEYFETIKCVTFGSPLVFCKDVKNSFFYKKLNDKIINFVYQFDLVPRLQNGMEMEYRNKLLKSLLLSQLPVSNIDLVFDVNQRLNYILNKFHEHQWLLDRYRNIGKYIVLFEKEEPRPIVKDKKCFTKSAKSYHLVLDSKKVLTMTSMLPHDEQIYAGEVLNDHKMLNYMKTIMFQQF